MLAEAAVEPEPPALLSPSPRPTLSYLGAVLNTNGGGHLSSTSTSPTVAALTRLSVVEGKPLRVRHRARPRCRTGRCNCPRAPNPSDEATPSHPSSTLGGLSTPTQTKLAQATSPCCSEVLSTTPYSTTPHTPSLFPSNFVGITVSSAGDNAHPFQTCGPTPPPGKRTQRKLCPHCVCHPHGPQAPNQAGPLLRGQRHQPRAPNQSTRHGWA
jgi:hypothetical protein